MVSKLPIIWNGAVAKLRGLDRKAGEEWAAMFGPHSMRTDFVRHAGALLLESRRSLVQGTDMIARNAASLGIICAFCPDMYVTFSHAWFK